MSNTIIIKSGASAPTTKNLAASELGFDTKGKALYIGTGDSTIKVGPLSASEVRAKVAGDVESIETGGTGASDAKTARENLGAFGLVAYTTQRENDINNCLDTGFYLINSACTNSPLGSEAMVAGVLCVYADVYLTQTIYYGDGRVFQRTATSESNLSLTGWTRIDAGAVSYSSLGTVPIANGGTSATTAAEALINLGAFPTVTVIDTAGTNLNDYKESGLWYFGVDYAPTNVPAGSNGWLMVIKGGTINQTKQIWFRHGTANTNDHETYVRTQTSTNTWSNWSRLVTKEDDLRFYSSLVPYGTSIGENADLNTTAYLKVGNYYCSKIATAQTLANCPTTNAFMMQVYSPLSTTVDNETSSTWVYRFRRIITHTGIEYTQEVSSGSTAGTFTYGVWKRVMKNILTSDDYGTSLPSSGTTGQIFFKY